MDDLDDLIITVERVPAKATSAREQLRNRILAYLRQQGSHPGYPYASYAMLRRQMGGKVPVEKLRAALEELLDEGAILEVWVVGKGRRPGPHLIVALEVLGDRWLRPDRILRARGRRTALERAGLGVYVPDGL